MAAGNFTVGAVTFNEADLMLRKSQAKTNTISANTVFFDGDFYVNGKSDVEILVSFNSKATKNQSVKLENLKLTSFKKGEYQKSQNNIEGGDYQMKGGNGFVAGRTITIGDARLNLTKTSSSTTSKIVNGSSTETVVYRGTLRNGGVDTLTINDMSVAFENSATNADKVKGSVSVKIGDQTFGPEDLKLDTATTHATTGSFGNVGFTVEPGKSYPIEVAFLLDGIVKVSDRQGNTSDAIVGRNLGEVAVEETADIQFSASTLNVKNALIKTNQEQTVARFSMTNKNAETFINKVEAGFSAMPSQVEVRVYEGNDRTKVVFDQTVAPTTNTATIDATSESIKPNTKYTVEVLASFGTPGPVTLNSVKLGFDGAATLTDAKQTSTVLVANTTPEITVVRNAGNDDILTFDIEANGDDPIKLELGAANISVAGFDPATWNKAVVLVDGTEVNVGNATKKIEVPANSKVRVTIQRGTMNFDGNATKGVLRVMKFAVDSTSALHSTAADLSSSNASNIVFDGKSSNDGTRVVGDWSQLRGEFSI